MSFEDEVRSISTPVVFGIDGTQEAWIDKTWRLGEVELQSTANR